MQEDEKFTGKRIFVIGLMAGYLVILDSRLATMDWVVHAKVDGAALSFYNLWLTRGHNILFPEDTRVGITTIRIAAH